MKKKISYIALIICTLAVALFWDNDIARTLLSFELLLVPCLFMLSVYLERNLSASLVVPDRYVPKGEKFEVDVHVSNASVLPMSTVPVTLLCHSRPSSRESAYTRDAFVTPGSGSSLCFLPAYRLLRQAVFQYRKGRSEGLPEPLYTRVQRYRT